MIVTKPRSAKVEAIEMRERRYGYFPRTFMWRGHEYNVEAVEKAETTFAGAKLNRHYFQVRCAEGVFVVFQDLKANTWHIEVRKGMEHDMSA